jgi:hypothetical protein
MDYMEPIRTACEELSEDIAGLQAEFDDAIHLRLTDPALIADFSRLCHRSVGDIPTPPQLYYPRIPIYDTEQKSYFPWLSPFADYITENQSLLADEAVVSFVKGTGTKSTNKSYLRDRQNTLDDRGIEREKQILVLLDDRISESVTQKLASYYLLTEGWMVVEWFSPNLRFEGNRHHPSYGIPDLVAWQSDLTKELAQRGWIRGGGKMHELAMLAIREKFTEDDRITTSDTDRTLVGEVKGSKRSLGEATKQLHRRGNSGNIKPGYLRSHCFDEGYGIIPYNRGKTRTTAGVISFDDQGFYVQNDPKKETYAGNEIEGETRADPKTKHQFISHLDTVLAHTLLSNVPMDELLSLVNVGPSTTPNAFLRDLEELPPHRILESCEEILF